MNTKLTWTCIGLVLHFSRQIISEVMACSCSMQILCKKLCNDYVGIPDTTGKERSAYADQTTAKRPLHMRGTFLNYRNQKKKKSPSASSPSLPARTESAGGWVWEQRTSTCTHAAEFTFHTILHMNPEYSLAHV